MWKQTHHQLTRLAQLSAGYDLQLGRLLLAGLRQQVHSRTGFDTFADYAEAMFGLEARHVAARIRVAVALEKLPLMRAALADGLLRWSVVRELTRVATPGTEAAWIDHGENTPLDTLRVELRSPVVSNNCGELAKTSGPIGRVDVQCEQVGSLFLTSKPPGPIGVAIR